MWQVYQEKGKEVAIKSTFSDFQKALQSEVDAIGEVEYIYYDERYEKDMEVNILSPFFYKRKSFEEESEFRAIVSDFEPPDGKPVGNELVRAVDSNSSSGKPVYINKEQLINEVYISPVAGDWLKKLVKNVLRTYRMSDIPVQYSRIHQDPFSSD
jgi:hypothetical protein